MKNSFGFFSQAQTDKLAQLPIDIKYEIFSRLSLKEVTLLSQSNKKWHDIIKHLMIDIDNHTLIFLKNLSIQANKKNPKNRITVEFQELYPQFNKIRQLKTLLDKIEYQKGIYSLFRPVITFKEMGFNYLELLEWGGFYGALCISAMLTHLLAKEFLDKLNVNRVTEKMVIGLFLFMISIPFFYFIFKKWDKKLNDRLLDYIYEKFMSNQAELEALNKDFQYLLNQPMPIRPGINRF